MTYLKPNKTYTLMALALVSVLQSYVQTEVQLLEVGRDIPNHYAREANQHELVLKVKQDAAELAQQLTRGELAKDHDAVVMSQPDETRQAVQQREEAEQLEQLDAGLEGSDEALKTLVEREKVQTPEINKLQAEHEAAQQELKKQFEDKQREQSLMEEKLEKAYFERHPDQSDAERLRDEQKFEGAKQHNQEDLLTRQQAQMDELLRKQQEQLQQVERDQQSQAQKDAQLRQEFEQNKDDMFR